MANSLCEFWKRPAFALAFCFLLSACGSDTQVSSIKLDGPVFGTRWHLTYLDKSESPVPTATIEAAVLEAFAVVNDSMNHYDPESLISEFNRLEALKVIEVDWDFTYVLESAIDISLRSAGAYDPTVSPAVNLWGFGPEGPSSVPSGSELESVATVVGIKQIVWDPTIRSLMKRADGVRLDFSSIAKGYAVDLAADALDELGIEHFMLEVGGEIQVRGQSPRGGDWRLAIEQPDPTGGRKMIDAVVLTNMGVATSGDYRNYFTQDGVRYSHLIDPRSVKPIEHDLVSVTVMHPSTMVADAWATAFMIAGTAEAKTLADINNLGVFMVSRQGDDLVTYANDSMTSVLMSQQTDNQ
ncbi:MAG: FAD:protein FMN transferase [Luminiphilus sp.]|nr:FAD:protein FMN transferase [Luminiphilus sp.]